MAEPSLHTACGRGRSPSKRPQERLTHCIPGCAPPARRPSSLRQGKHEGGGSAWVRHKAAVQCGHGVAHRRPRALTAPCTPAALHASGRTITLAQHPPVSLIISGRLRSSAGSSRAGQGRAGVGWAGVALPLGWQHQAHLARSPAHHSGPFAGTAHHSRSPAAKLTADGRSHNQALGSHRHRGLVARGPRLQRAPREHLAVHQVDLEKGGAAGRGGES